MLECRLIGSQFLNLTLVRKLFIILFLYFTLFNSDFVLQQTYSWRKSFEQKKKLKKVLIQILTGITCCIVKDNIKESNIFERKVYD